jgi:hypothetical protein
MRYKRSAELSVWMDVSVGERSEHYSTKPDNLGVLAISNLGLPEVENRVNL